MVIGIPLSFSEAYYNWVRESVLTSMPMQPVRRCCKHHGYCKHCKQVNVASNLIPEYNRNVWIFEYLYLFLHQFLTRVYPEESRVQRLHHPVSAHQWLRAHSNGALTVYEHSVLFSSLLLLSLANVSSAVNIVNIVTVA